ncbi:MAG: thiamine-phosphate kinase [Burkholderiaceae bacterium]|nr:thiamine-phosphate kinase [Roseateles sp.]MBV8468969.1 thiamine-phosphate kinase [Burkholderiaceae bacterium]
MGEFDLIRRYFERPNVQEAAASPAQGVQLGIGDDCAVLRPTPGHDWLVSTDMLVEGRHFLSTVAPGRLGHKALAVNLSDLAACGATPRAFTLALSMPRVDEDFLQGFAQGLFALADAHGIALVGGDTTAGPLNVCITVMGEAPPGQALLRSGARAGDDIYVSGQLGDARLALEVFRGKAALTGEAFEQVRQRMECPQPRVLLGQALRGLASSAIDVSDGLSGDLGHVLQRSGVGAALWVDALPRSPVMAAQPAALQLECLLNGGDDYELVFTAPPQRRHAVQAAANASHTAISLIGRIEAEAGLRVLDGKGQRMNPGFRSFDHFKS